MLDLATLYGAGNATRQEGGGVGQVVGWTGLSKPRFGLLSIGGADGSASCVNGRYRRYAVVAGHSRERLLTEPTADFARPVMARQPMPETV